MAQPHASTSSSLGQAEEGVAAGERFPLLVVLACLTAVTLVATPALAWLGPRLFATAGDEAQRAVLVGAVTAFGATALSLVPVAIMAPHGMGPLVGAYFGGALVRLFGCVAVVALAVTVWELPAGPLVLGLGLYVPLLLIETGLIGRHLWRKDDAAHGSAKTTTESSP